MVLWAFPRKNRVKTKRKGGVVDLSPSYVFFEHNVLFISGISLHCEGRLPSLPLSPSNLFLKSILGG